MFKNPDQSELGTALFRDSECNPNRLRSKPETVGRGHDHFVHESLLVAAARDKRRNGAPVCQISVLGRAGPVSLKLNSCQSFPALCGYDCAPETVAREGPVAGDQRVLQRLF